MDGCVFCAIIAGAAPASVIEKWDDAIAFVPLNPVTGGHTLVAPLVHVADFAENPAVTAATAARAAELALAYPGLQCNLITSRGRAATQSVWHLHWHLVPRTENDGLALPWYSGRSRRTHRTERELHG